MRVHMFWLWLLSSCAISLYGQQSEQYSLQNFNPYMYNPAYAGFDGSLSINAHVRSQWNEIQGNPRSQHVNTHLPMNLWNGGVGLALENESLGAWQQTKLSISANYVQETGTALISFGANVGFIQNRLNGLELITVDGDYEGIINHNDPILPASKVGSSAYFIDIGVVIAYRQLQILLSANNINEPSFALNEIGVTNAVQQRSYYLGARYHWEIAEDIQLQPMVLLKTNIDQLQSDVILSGIYQHQFMVGAGYRGYSGQTSDGVLMLFGFRISENFWMRYAYDLGISDLAVVGNGSHEISLSYDLNKILGSEIRPKIIYNPRFLE